MELNVAEIFLDSSTGSESTESLACSRRHLCSSRHSRERDRRRSLIRIVFNCVPLARLGGLPLGECGQERKLKATSNEVSVYFYPFASAFTYTIVAPSLFFILFVLCFSSGPSSSYEPESMVRWYARGIVQLFLADGSLYRGPPLKPPVRDVTPTKMATEQAPIYYFFQWGSECQVSAGKVVFHASSSLPGITSCNASLISSSVQRHI